MIYNLHGPIGWYIAPFKSWPYSEKLVLIDYVHKTVNIISLKMAKGHLHMRASVWSTRRQLAKQ